MLVKSRSGFSQALELLPERLADIMSSVPPETAVRVCEIRLRKGRFLSAVISGREYFVDRHGGLSRSAEGAAEVTDSDIAFAFKTAFRGSVHSFPRELSEGFITCEGGNRVGFCGTASLAGENGQLVVRDISSVNIRIAHEVKGCAEKLFDMAFGNGLVSLIISSPPCGGKTTVLRDLCRILGSTRKVSLIDERSEIAAVCKGTPRNDTGLFTDVFNSYPKAQAIMTAVRTMSPDIVICDEIGAEEDYAALSYAANSGAKLICTCHSPSFRDLMARPVAGRLIKSKIFDCAAILGTGDLCGKVVSFIDIKTEREK